jgi:photosystem II stability/assembly factor-like uncharacterized protein
VTKTWTRVDAGTTEHLTTVCVDGAERVWVTTEKGALLCSTDGAKRFRHVAQGPASHPAGLWSDGARRLVVCASGVVSASDDEGETWAPTSCRGRHNDNLGGLDGGVLVATNIRSSVLVSRDGGVRWKATKPGWTRYLYSVAGNAHGTLCAGSDGALMISRDAGARWKVTRVKHRDYLRGACVTPAGAVVLVGDAGRVERVDTKGVHRSTRLDDGACLYDVCGRGEDELFAVGHCDYAPVFRASADGGATWTAERATELDGVRCVLGVARVKDLVVAVGERGGVWVRS